MEAESKETCSHQGNKMLFILQPHCNLQRTGGGTEDFGEWDVYIRKCFSFLKSLLMDKKAFLSWSCNHSCLGCLNKYILIHGKNHLRYHTIISILSFLKPWNHFLIVLMLRTLNNSTVRTNSKKKKTGIKKGRKQNKTHLLVCVPGMWYRCLLKVSIASILKKEDP